MVDEPTLDPQGKISMQRFEKVIKQNHVARKVWKKEGDNAFRMAKARISFLSAAAGSNIVGATASGLLEVDEADVVILDSQRLEIRRLILVKMVNLVRN